MIRYSDFIGGKVYLGNNTAFRIDLIGDKIDLFLIEFQGAGFCHFRIGEGDRPFQTLFGYVRAERAF